MAARWRADGRNIPEPAGAFPVTEAGTGMRRRAIMRFWWRLRHVWVIWARAAAAGAGWDESVAAAWFGGIPVTGLLAVRAVWAPRCISAAGSGEARFFRLDQSPPVTGTRSRVMPK